MTPRRFRRLIPAHHIEFLLMLAVFAGLFNLIRVYIYYGYLPLPFVYDVTDTFMDWFNPAYYAHNGHAYSAYTSIYAPLSFVILKIFGDPACYGFHPKDARACDVVGIASILVCYALCMIFSAIAFYKKDRSTALFRTVGFSLGLPLLYALERGNLIMISFIFFIIFFGIAQSKSGISSAAAMMINMKSYLLFPVLALAIKRDWRTLELCGFATVGLYVVTLAIYGSGTPFELMNNLQVWFNAMSSVVWDQISYSTTYKPFLQFDIHQYPVRDFIKDKIVNIVTIMIHAEVFASRLVAILCLIFSWFYPRAISLHRIAFFFLMQSFISDNPGGYGQSFIVFLVFLEKWSNVRVGIAIVLTYIISIPTDYVFAIALHVPRVSWLSARDVDTIYGISTGALVRPALIIVILWALAIDSLIDFHRAIKAGRPKLGLAGSPPLPSAGS
jgi:hypothetical protein